MFQYPLFRIELLSKRRVVRLLRSAAVSISALSDRIAQRLSISPPSANHSVSISALSDRIAQRRGALPDQWAWTGFNIRSFGSNCSASGVPVAWAGKDRFNIRSFGSNCSARWYACSWRIRFLFQYPLFRIELLSLASAARAVTPY